MTDETHRKPETEPSASAPPDTSTPDTAGAPPTRRRLGYGLGITAAAVAVLLAATLGGGDVPAASDTDRTQSTGDLPELDPDRIHHWESTGGRERTDETRRLDEHIRSFLDERYPDHEPYDEDSPIDVYRFDNELRRVSPDGADETVHTQPVYRLGGLDPETLSRFGGVALALHGMERGGVDTLALAVYPAGGFVEGTDSRAHDLEVPTDGHLAQGCDEFALTGGEEEIRYEFTCRNPTGPNDERILQVEQTQRYPDAQVAFVARTVVVITESGNAVWVSTDWFASIFGDGEEDLPSVTEPTMTFDELTELAVTLPDVVVE